MSRTSLSRRRSGFSLLEALIAVGVIGLAGSAILLATDASTRASDDAMEQLIARGLANQIIDEIMGLPYKEKGQAAEAWPLGKEAGESTRRVSFDDSDDFNGYSAYPPSDSWGVELGQGDGAGGVRPSAFRVAADYFDDWAVRVAVSYVDETDLSLTLASPETSGARAVEVVIYRVELTDARDETEDAEIVAEHTKTVTELLRIRRVCSYVPPFGG